MRMAPDCPLPATKGAQMHVAECAQVDSSKMLINCICLDLNFTTDCYIKVKKSYSRL